MWRGGFSENVSVPASFVWRCLTGPTLAPFSDPAHRTRHPSSRAFVAKPLRLWEKLLAATVQAGLDSGAVKPASLERVSVDTTVQPKAIAHPTDSRLYLKALLALVRQAHTRLAKRAAAQVARYAHARQTRRMRRELKRLKTYLGRVHRDLDRKLAAAADAALDNRFARLMGLVGRLLLQQRNSKDKLYSPYAPEVVCLAKGKAHKPYELGAKVALAVTNREGFALAAKAVSGSPYDGHTLAGTFEQIVAITGIEPERIYADKGYRGHDYLRKERVFLSGQRRGLTPSIKREPKRRSAGASGCLTSMRSRLDGPSSGARPTAHPRAAERAAPCGPRCP